jgi:hypothetical protein
MSQQTPPANDGNMVGRSSRFCRKGRFVARQGNHSRNVWPGQFISNDGPAAMLPPGSRDLNLLRPGIAIHFRPASITLSAKLPKITTADSVS